MTRFADILARLSSTIEARKGSDPAASYTARLLADPKLNAKKLGEESVELIIAGMEADPQAIAAESADLIYHWLVFLAGRNVSLDQVAERLEAREGTSGLAEEAARAPG